MIYLTLPKPIRFVADRFNDFCQDFSYSTLCSLICYFLFNCESLSDLARRFPFSKSVSALAAAAKLFPHKKFRSRLLSSVLRKLGATLTDPKNQGNWAFVVDDTDNPKFGKCMFENGLWGSSKGTYKGQKIMTLSLVNLITHQAIPIAYEIIPKRKNKKDPSAITFVTKLVKKALDCGYPKLPVVADSWFDSVDLMADIQSLGCHCLIEIKQNRRVKINPGSNVKTTTLEQAFIKKPRVRLKTSWDSKEIQQGKRAGKCCSELFVKINRRNGFVKCIAVYNRKDNASPFAYYISTDPSISRARMWMLSRARWSIECIFRTVKQNLSFGSLSCQGENAAHLALVYAILSLRTFNPRKA